jgi:hypothetical protein
MRLDVCRHYRGPVVNDDCHVGVNYAELTKANGLVKIAIMPCIKSNVTDVVCDQRDFPTEEEVETFNREAQEQMRITDEAYRRCAEHAVKEGYKKHEKGASGQVECPKCGGILKYSCATNGHIWAKCTTKTCDVSWVQ